MAKLLVVLYVLLSCVVLAWLVSPAFADPLKSSNYTFEETTLGGTGIANSQSANFQATGTGAVLGAGLNDSSSANFIIKSGSPTTNDPALAFNVMSANVSLGDFSPGAAATATATFQVVDYTSYGYVVQAFGTPPTRGGHTISAMTSTGPSQAGVEQFGINLVANTSPISVGANPDHGQFGVGSASSNYGTPNNYRYVAGETIALAPKSSGLTTYTISYLVNVNTLTPGGQYAGDQTLLCTGTY